MNQLKSTMKVGPYFKENLFHFCREFQHVAWLDSHSNLNEGEGYDLILALGASALVNIEQGSKVEELISFLSQESWKFGFFSYDLKNQFFEGLSSSNLDRSKFPDAYFFVPELLIQINGDLCTIEGGTEEEHRLIQEIDESQKLDVRKGYKVEVIPSLSEEVYVNKVEQIKERIQRGDVYEVNFCHEFYAEGQEIDPYDLHLSLMEKSPSPFSSFVRCDSHYVLCSSPERFIKKQGNHLLSQPIKGTIRRGENEEEDELLKTQLRGSDKEQAENVMIVDLVRNDLSRVALDGSVRVDELFGIYSFAQVHQMISTVSCKVAEASFEDIIQNTFPMGSMTGAPKKKALEIIEEVEESRRGVYSGSIGYVDPNGDFDFNVVIRSILYNADEQMLSFSVGGAITHYCDAKEEYQESLLKAKGMIDVLK